MMSKRVDDVLTAGGVDTIHSEHVQEASRSVTPTYTRTGRGPSRRCHEGVRLDTSPDRPLGSRRHDS